MGFRLERQDAEIREMTRALADLDNKLNSPKMRNPFLMKQNTTERCSPNMSPRCGSSTSIAGSSCPCKITSGQSNEITFSQQFDACCNTRHWLSIIALWKKVSTMQGGSTTADSATQAPSDDASSIVERQVSSAAATTTIDISSIAAVHDLAKTCTMLTSQVYVRLTKNMRRIFSALEAFGEISMASVYCKTVYLPEYLIFKWYFFTGSLRRIFLN
ncbi:uncharacterized protein [Eurosta solidaginis]|uniref:uncharacterized protein n=1 Tax=Eurosta solidaginis TaxID=178769 RepID=UPI0035310F7F